MRKEYKKNQKNLEKRTKRRRGWKIFRNSMMVVALLVLVALGGLVTYAYNTYKPMYDEMYIKSVKKLEGIHKDSFKERANSKIYDTDGKLMKKLSINDYYYVEYKNIPKQAEDALLSIEDVRFYAHKGVDYPSLARASVKLIQNNGEITQGGSTITQQLVKLRFLTLEKSYERKIQEVIIARELEKRFSKTQILEFYLNTINYGNGAYGIQSASKTYFRKNVNDLSLSQLAFLTGVPNNPSVYNPVTNYDNAISRRNVILSKMLEYGKISKEDYSKAINEKIKIKLKKKVYKEDSYAVSFVISSASTELMRENGFEFKYWFKTANERKKYKATYNEAFKEAEYEIRNGGYKIYSTIDTAQQDKLQSVVNRKLAGFTAKDMNSKLYKLQGSATTIDNETGDVIAIVGGRTQSDVHNTYNRAFLSSRQPGSSIKPLLVYTPSFEQGELAMNRYVDKKFKNGPNNVDMKFRGSMTIRDAVARSTNTVAYQLINKYTPRNMLTYLEKLEFRHLAPTDNTSSVALGGFTYGTNTYEMASAFSTLARGGQYIRTTGIDKIENAFGETIYKNKREGMKVYDSGTSYLMTDVLTGVFKKDFGTGKRFALKNMNAAAKTGTTNGYRDVWFAGYTPYYTTVTWIGYDTPQALPNTSSMYTGGIWKEYMTQLHKDKGLKNKAFKKSNRVKTAYVNPYTGEVSDSYRAGWTKQLVTSVYLEKKLEAKAKAEAEAKAKVEALAKKAAEEKAHKAKLRREELKRLNMTESDVKEEKEKAYALVAELQALRIATISDYKKTAAPLIESVGESLQDIKFSTTYKEVKQAYDAQVQRIKGELDTVKNQKIAEEQAEATRREERIRLKNLEAEQTKREQQAKDDAIAAKNAAAKEAERQAKELAEAEEAYRKAQEKLKQQQSQSSTPSTSNSTTTVPNKNTSTPSQQTKPVTPTVDTSPQDSVEDNEVETSIEDSEDDVE